MSVLEILLAILVPSAFAVAAVTTYVSSRTREARTAQAETRALAALTVDQDRRLAERAAATAALEAADGMRTALLGAVGHDLRTPLAALRAAVDGLRSEIVLTEDERAELVSTARTATVRLTALVDNLLAASRLEAGAVASHPEPVGLVEVVDRASVDLPNRSRIYLDIPDDLPEVTVDVGLAERVLANLLQNALAYSPAGTMVTVAGRVRDGEVRCDVIDHGPGIAPERRRAVFTPFQRLGDRGPPGLGLGLSVARGLTQAIGGSLTLQDTPGGGLTMRLTLPLAGRP